MSAKNVFLIVTTLFVLGYASFGAEYTDSFDVDHDYSGGDTTGTIWDGFVYNDGISATQDTVVDDAATAGGTLNLASTWGDWENGNDDAMLLYINVAACLDFVATVDLTSYIYVNYNSVGIMARDATASNVDYVQSMYFDNFSVGGQLRSTHSGGTANFNSSDDTSAQMGAAINFLKLEKSGSTFTASYSTDGGVTFTSTDTIERADLDLVDLQVGLFQATYGSGLSGTASFDNFSLTTTSPSPFAEYLYPANDAVNVKEPVTLEWKSGFGAQSHDIYVSTDYSGVLNATTGSPEFKGNQLVPDLTYTLPSAIEGQRYYWRVDAFDGSQTHPGAVWSFTVFELQKTLEDFEAYADTAALQQAWQAQGNVVAELSQSPLPVNEGTRAMKATWSNQPNQQSRIVYTLPQVSQWDLKNVEAIAIYLYGQPGNDPVPMALGLSQNDWGSDLVTIPMDAGQVDIQVAQWQRWDVDLRGFRESNPAIDLDGITQLNILVGSEEFSQAAAGIIYIDPILIHQQRCLGVNEPMADFNDDCEVNMLDLKDIAQNWLNSGPIGDTNSDNSVNLPDLANLASDWIGAFALWPQAATDRVMLSMTKLDDVEVTGGIWQQRQTTVHDVTVWDVFGQCESTGRIENFYRAAGIHSGPFQGTFFDDSDVYKAMEGAAYILRKDPGNTALRNYMDTLIDVMDQAQEPDGYLYTFGTLTDYVKWSNIANNHELYCAGHMFEAAVEYYKTTGDNQFLNIAIRFADLIDSVFGPGKNLYPPGHQEIELALIKLYEVTGESRYFDLAKFFTDQRGNPAGRVLYGYYSQDHVPFIEQDEALGHSVRHEYLCIGAADIAMINHDQDYFDALKTHWDSVTGHKQYITGGVGHHHYSEGYSSNYDLPNDLAYCETCASIANVMWNQRMFLIYGDGKYGDVMERTLLNGVLSGLSLDGGRYYYTNPLDAFGAIRPEWYGTACCPPNLLRVISDIGSYAYGQKDDAVYVNLYMQADSNFDLSAGTVTLSMTTDYPWDGQITMNVTPDTPRQFDLYLRIPGWVRNQPFPTDLYRYLNESQPTWTLTVNDAPVSFEMEKGFAKISRVWQSGDQVKLNFPMTVRRIVSNPAVQANEGLVSLARGPVVYCFETHDVPSGELDHLLISDTDTFTAQYNADMLEVSGTQSPGVVLTGNVQAVYEEVGGSTVAQSETVRAIPYYAWMHRGTTHMRVWMPRDISKTVPMALPPDPVSELWGHWKLDEISGTIAADSSPDTNNHAACSNGLSFDTDSVTGVDGLALKFDGIDDYLDAPDGYDNFEAGVTVSVWAYTTANKTWSRFLDFGNGSLADNIILGRRSNSDDLFFEAYNRSDTGGQVLAPNAIKLNQWQMFTATCQPDGSVTMYVDGQPVNTGATFAPRPVTRVNNYIGRSNWAGDEFYQGRLDDVRIYTYPLTQQEVLALYNSTK